MTRLCRNVEKLIINIPRYILTTTVTIYKAEHAYQHNTIMNRRILSKRWGKEGKRQIPSNTVPRAQLATPMISKALPREVGGQSRHWRCARSFTDNGPSLRR